MVKQCFIDFETRSTLDVTDVGIVKYAADYDTSVLCMAYNLTGKKKSTKLWWPGDPPPKKLLKHVKRGGIVKAVNAAFELEIWNEVAAPSYDWPDLKLEQIRCTAAKARAAGFPGGLDRLCKALRTKTQKDEDGKRLIKLLCVPQRITKANPDKWNNDPAELRKLGEYCKDDVNSEMEADELLPEMHPDELKTYQMDYRFNRRGVSVDLEAVDAAIEVTNVFQTIANKEIYQLTDGAVEKGTQAQRIRDWATAMGYPMPNLQEKTVNDAIADIDKRKKPGKKLKAIRKVLHYRKALGRGSTGKYPTIKQRAVNDRVYETVVYHSAHCVTGDTEVLTPQGWKKLSKWQGGKIAQYDIESKGIEFLKAKRYKGPKVDKWVNVTSNYLDLDMTYGHKVPTLDGPIQAAELIGRKPITHICSGTLKANGLPLTDYQVKYIAMMQADGHINKHNAIRFNFRKQRKIDRCKEILDNCDIEYTYTENGYYIRQSNCGEWMFKAKYFGKWMLKLNPHQRSILIEELIHWDGKYETGINGLASVIKSNVEWVQILCHLSGVRTGKLAEHLDKRTGNTIYSVSVLKRTKEHLTFKREQVTEKVKKQRTYCTETITGWWVARRNGKVFITGNTGRWAGSGIQTQNFPRPTMKGIDPEEIIATLKTRDIDLISSKYYDPYVCAVNALRCVLTASPGKTLSAADYSAVEARVLMWWADELEALEQLHSGDCLYTHMAAEIYGHPYKKIYKGYLAGEFEFDQMRFFGKQSILGLGFQMAWKTFQAQMAGYGKDITNEFAQKTVKVYRGKYKKVVKLWSAVESAALNTVLTGKRHTVNGVTFAMYKHWLTVTLPSGRTMYYPYAGIANNKWGKPCVSYTMYTKKGPVVETTYGGMMTENIVQAMARDLLRDAMLRLERKGFTLLLTIHDEIVAEIDTKKAKKTSRAMCDVMTKTPKWAKGVPVDVSGWYGFRYRKG